MAECVFKLRTPTVAVLSENEQRRVVTIPAQALITIVAGDLACNGLLKIRYRNQDLEMFALDLRTRAEIVLEQPA